MYIEIQEIAGVYYIRHFNGKTFQELGKSTLLSLAEVRGKSLARILKCPFYDLRTSIDNRIFQLTSV